MGREETGDTSSALADSQDWLATELSQAQLIHNRCKFTTQAGAERCMTPFCVKLSPATRQKRGTTAANEMRRCNSSHSCLAPKSNWWVSVSPSAALATGWEKHLGALQQSWCKISRIFTVVAPWKWMLHFSSSHFQIGLQCWRNMACSLQLGGLCIQLCLHEHIR